MKLLVKKVAIFTYLLSKKCAQYFMNLVVRNVHNVGVQLESLIDNHRLETRTQLSGCLKWVSEVGV